MLGLFLLATNVDDLIEKAAEAFYIKEDIETAWELIQQAKQMAPKRKDVDELYKEIEAQARKKGLIGKKEEASAEAEDVDTLISKASDAYAAGNLEEAYRLLKKAEKLDPANEQIKEFIKVVEEELGGPIHVEEAKAPTLEKEVTTPKGSIAKKPVKHRAVKVAKKEPTLSMALVRIMQRRETLYRKKFRFLLSLLAFSVMWNFILVIVAILRGRRSVW